MKLSPRNLNFVSYTHTSQKIYTYGIITVPKVHNDRAQIFLYGTKIPRSIWALNSDPAAWPMTPISSTQNPSLNLHKLQAQVLSPGHCLANHSQTIKKG